MKKIGIVFPGQGSQKVGMGQDLIDKDLETQALFEIANNILKTDIKELCIEGPEDLLRLTKNAQPAIFLVSFALFKKLQKKGIQAHLLAGHSLGELTAYAAANILSFEDTLKIIKKRGEEMNKAASLTESGMAAIMGKSSQEIESIISIYKNEPVVIANHNCPGQIVISGKKEALEKAYENLKQSGAKVIPLPVSGAFHSPLMSDASNALKDYLDTFKFSDAKTPIILNQTGNKESYNTSLKENLSKQVVSPVKWIDSIETMAKEVDIILECGPGRVLSGLIKKINRDINIKTINNLTSINELDI